MKPWWQVAIPHKNIREDKFDESMFFADLGKVARGEGSIEYRDAAIFFNKTVLTEGLKNLIVVVLKKLAGRGGEAIIRIETPFGGGKTHALIALYHILKHGNAKGRQEIKALLNAAGLKEVPKAKVAVLEGTSLDALKGRRVVEGLTIRTLWGELAYQLGGKGFYNIVKEHDEKRVAPGKEVLNKLLSKAGPALILMDELLEYIVKAAAVKIEEGTLKGQTISFLQELTEVVSSLERAVLIATLPSSHLERYDEAAEELFHQLSRVFGRVETLRTPVEGEEIYEIIRRRLFDKLGEAEEHRKVAEEFFEMYLELEENIPSKARRSEYRDKIAKAYPFHPELIDLLHEKWGSIAGFQRTRGVLRFLANVVADLYKKEHPSPLILPAHVNLASPAIKEELVKHIGTQYKSVIASDISGRSSKALQLDDELGSEYSKYKIASGIATSVFLHSFGGGEARKGANLPTVRLSLLRKEISYPLVGDAINTLESSEGLWFLYSEGGFYWFSDIPNLNKILIDKEETVTEDDILRAIKEKLEQILGSEFKTYLWVREPRDVADLRKVSMAVAPLEYPYGRLETEKYVKNIFENYASGFRKYKNTLIFLLADKDSLTNLRKIARRKIALDKIKTESALVKAFTEDQRKDLEQRMRNAEKDLPEQLKYTYRYIMISSEDGLKSYDMGLQSYIAGETICKKVRDFLRDSEDLLSSLDPTFIVTSVWSNEKEFVSTNEIWDAFLKYPQLPMLENEDVLLESLIKGISIGTFGLGIGTEIDKLSRTNYREEISKLEIDIGDSYLLLKPQKAKELVGKPEEEIEEYKPEEEEEKITTRVAEKRVKEFVVKAEVPWDKFSEVFSGVIRPLRSESDNITTTIEISASSEQGIKKDTIEMKVKETLSQIKAKILELTYK